MRVQNLCLSQYPKKTGKRYFVQAINRMPRDIVIDKDEQFLPFIRQRHEHISELNINCPPNTSGLNYILFEFLYIYCESSVRDRTLLQSLFSGSPVSESLCNSVNPLMNFETNKKKLDMEIPSALQSSIFSSATA